MRRDTLQIMSVSLGLLMLSYILPALFYAGAVYMNQAVFMYLAIGMFYVLKFFAILGAVTLAGVITKNQYFSIVRKLPLLG